PHGRNRREHAADLPSQLGAGPEPIRARRQALVARRGIAMIESAQIALVRVHDGALELFVMRRTGAYALPGGTIQDGEAVRAAAARVLFEDCGVLLARDAGQAETLEMLSFATLRKKIRAGAHATELLRSVGLTWANEA